MNPQPLVTIITNTKNRASLISRCIESIQNQTYQNYEHIIADGGNDDTAEIVKAYNDPHIIYIKITNGDQIKQTAEAFAISKGEYITFLDDDDEYLPQKIEKQIELIQSLPDDYGLIYGSMTYYDNNTGKQLKVHEAIVEGGDLLLTALSGPIVCGTPTLMFRRNVFGSIGGTWISNIGNNMSDWALVCKALKAGWKVGALKESYLKIYINHSSQRMSSTTNSVANAEKYIKFHSYFLNEYDDQFKISPKSSVKHVESLFIFNMLAKHRMTGVKYWFRLLRLRPNFRTIGLFPLYFYKSIKTK